MRISKCFVKHLTTGKTVLINRGVMGYTELDEIWSQKDPNELNAEIGVNKEQAQAMLIGSMFGWNVPGARIVEQDRE